MGPTEDAFRALARSSPWRWRTLHFTHRGARADAVEAWVRRPGELLVHTSDGREHREHGLPCTKTSLVVSVPSHGDILEVPERPRRTRLPHEVLPDLRPDGLVDRRPDRTLVDYDDPMWGNYTWVAMLDPVELSHHVATSRLREEEISGRPAWRADLVPETGYSPRCGGNCCELLYSEAGLMADFSGPEDVPDAWRGRTYPDAFDVALDVQTGVVVHLEPIGGARDDLAFTNAIHEADADLDALFP